MGDVLLAARDLRKTFGRGDTAVKAVGGVDIDVHAGEVVMIRGPSGSGKTTLLTMLGLLLHPDEGTVAIRGRVVSGLSESELPAVRRENIGFVFQNFLLLPALSTLENVEVAANLGGQRGEAARRKARELLTEVGLGHRLDSRPTQLSGGERQRVGLARALANDARILLADEPTGNLDSKSGRRVMEILRHAALEHGCGVVVVSHDDRILPFIDTLYVMEDGKVVSRRSGTDISPADAATA